MSKDKGSKNHKKTPADKSKGKMKSISTYKSEGKTESGKDPALDFFAPKTTPKTAKKRKS